jgi:hypothetical protein
MLFQMLESGSHTTVGSLRSRIDDNDWPPCLTQVDLNGKPYMPKASAFFCVIPLRLKLIVLGGTKVSSLTATAVNESNLHHLEYLEPLELEKWDATGTVDYVLQQLARRVQSSVQATINYLQREKAL